MFSVKLKVFCVKKLFPTDGNISKLLILFSFNSVTRIPRYAVTLFFSIGFKILFISPVI